MKIEMKEGLSLQGSLSFLDNTVFLMGTSELYTSSVPGDSYVYYPSSLNEQGTEWSRLYLFSPPVLYPQKVPDEKLYSSCGSAGSVQAAHYGSRY